MGKLIKFISKYRTEVLILTASLLLAGISTLSSKQVSTISPEKEPSSEVDTLIPLGFTLIPIEIKNLSQTSYLIGEYGVVTLFESNNNKNPVAEGVRLIRSPLDSGHFAVLVPQNKSHVILNSKSPYYVTILNQKDYANKFNKPTYKKRRIRTGL